jgi:hypothetical protein
MSPFTPQNPSNKQASSPSTTGGFLPKQVLFVKSEVSAKYFYAWIIQKAVYTASFNKMSWHSIGLDYNAYWYIYIAKDVGVRWLVGMVFYTSIPFEIT